MGRLRGLGMCMAVAAVFAGSATSAAAEAPEFGRCVKQAGGSYSNNACTATAAGTGTYEWQAGPGPKAKFTEAVSGKKAFQWQLATNEQGICSGETATGEYTGPKTVGHVLIVLSGCVFSMTPCETVALEPMSGEIGVYALGETALQNKVGLKLHPESGEQLAEFNCGSTAGVNPYLWRGGSVTVPIASNKMVSKESLKYRQKQGPNYHEEQLPAGFVGDAPSILEGTGNGLTKSGEKVFNPMGWQTNIKLTNEEKLEANSVV